VGEAFLILDSIRSEYNVGSLFRTADAAGIGRLYLCGYTPAPKDRFGRASKMIAKVALGAEQTVPWEKRASCLALVRRLRKEGTLVIAVEQSPRSVDYKKAAEHVRKALRAGKGVAFILGEEVSGMPASLLKEADLVAEIPMNGKKESLNVSVAGGVALFRMLGI